VAACEWCGAQYAPTVRRNGVVGGRPQRFCSKRCADDSWNARKRIRPRAEPLVREYPLLLGLPPVPAIIWLAGLCVIGGYPPYWTSDDPGDRELAKRIHAFSYRA